jgi:hypothetical protein
MKVEEVVRKEKYTKELNENDKAYHEPSQRRMKTLSFCYLYKFKRIYTKSTTKLFSE